MRIDPTTRPSLNSSASSSGPVHLFESSLNDAESFVPDGRSLLRPAQVVEGRVFEVLQRTPVLISQFDRPARPRYR